MHKYLESIGFRRIKKRSEMDHLISNTVLHHDQKNVFRDEDGRIIGEFSRDYAPDMGMCVCGEFDGDGNFHPDYSFPYLRGNAITSCEDVTLERHADKHSFAGAVDDPRVGVTIIFYLINMGEIMCRTGMPGPDDFFHAVKITGLAREGKILLPAIKNEWWEKEERENLKEHIRLVTAAKDGDEDAIEDLTMEDMDAYTLLQQRIENEDIFSIVDSNFMPYGIECDQYAIVGTIQDVQKVKNDMSDEEVWKMEVLVCDMIFDVCINSKTLIGEPAVGRRFKGQVWLQGEVCL
ncbi:MAG: DUF3881 family protein [Lachnospiraceae bacterium]|nr:DUF3881 family protein [Lachnospiraceae bacterium]